MQVCYNNHIYCIILFEYLYDICDLRFLLNELSQVLSPKITAVQKLPIIKAESRWKTVINSVVSSIKTKKNVRNHKARNQHLPLQTTFNNEVIHFFDIL